jgi:DNA replication protein DnaD
MPERKIYKTMQGKTLDFDSIRLNNELVPAIGNMKVNARGDEIDTKGNIVRTKDQIVQEIVKKEEKTLEIYTEDFGPDPELTPEQALEILSKNRKNKGQEK